MEMFIFFISLIQYKKILRYRKSVFRRILSQADICDPYLASCLIWLKKSGYIKRSRAFKRHILNKKSSKRKRNLRKATGLAPGDAKVVMKMIKMVKR